MTTPNDNAPEVLASLSAMFDDEATTQDIDRLLSCDSRSLSRQLESFHLLQQTLHQDPAVAVGLGNSLVSRVRAQIESEEALGHGAAVNSMPRSRHNVIPLVQVEEVASSRSSWSGLFTGVAVAASVAFVVVLGGNLWLTPDGGEPSLAQQVAPKAHEVTPLADLNKNTLQADNLRLQNYLRQHAEQAAMTVGQGMMPMARVVSYPINE